MSKRRVKRQVNYDNDKQITAQRLQEAMANANITAAELSTRSKVSKSSISQYCHAVQSPSNLSAQALGKVLDVDPLWLMGFDVPMNYEEQILIEQANYQTNASTLDIFRNLGWDQFHIIEYYNHAPLDGRKELMNFVEYLISKYDLKETLSTIDEAENDAYFN